MVWLHPDSGGQDSAKLFLGCAEGGSSQLRFHESRLIGTAYGAPTGWSQPTVLRQGWSAPTKVCPGGIQQPLGGANVFRCLTLGEGCGCEKDFIHAGKCLVRGWVESWAEQHMGWRRSRRTTTTMTRRRPTEPPPIQRALASTGENKRCIMGLSFLIVVDDDNLFFVCRHFLK